MSGGVDGTITAVYVLCAEWRARLGERQGAEGPTEPPILRPSDDHHDSSWNDQA
jgi:hypothetical protein